MIFADIIELVRSQVANDLEFHKTSDNRVEVYTPFMYQDGDRCGFQFVRDDAGRWRITDEGDVLLHAGYSGVDLSAPGRAERFTATLKFFGLLESDGEISLSIDDETELGSAFFRFSQACLELMNQTKIPAKRPSVQGRQFHDKLKTIIEETVNSSSISHRWRDPQYDPSGIYPVDFRIATKSKQLFLFGVRTDIAALRAAVTCFHYKESSLEFESIAVYNNERDLNANSTGPLDEIADHHFASLDEGDDLAEFLKERAA